MDSCNYNNLVVMFQHFIDLSILGLERTKQKHFIVNIAKFTLKMFQCSSIRLYEEEIIIMEKVIDVQRHLVKRNASAKKR